MERICEKGDKSEKEKSETLDENVNNERRMVSRY
jgi:hypothetical protein